MKFLFLLSACVLLSFNGAYAQTQIFNETFETNSATEGSWTMVDRDGDGWNWLFQSSTIDGFSSRVISSPSNYGLSPDNLLISPTISLSAGKSYILSFLIGGGAVSSFHLQDHYAVYVLSATASFGGTETPLLTDVTQDNAVTKTVDISAYAGQSVKLYFRHYNSVNQYWVLLDNVIVTESATSGISASSESAAVSLSPNPVGSQLQVSVAGGDLQKVEVVDLNGRVARSVAASGASVSVDVSGLSAGVYVAKVLSGDGTVVRKFVKK